jgi:protein-disulfide isomerase
VFAVLATAALAWTIRGVILAGAPPWRLHSVAGVQQGDLDQRIREFILQNPKVIIESVQRLNDQQHTADASEVKKIVAARHTEIFNDPTSPTDGNANGDVSVVEFFDYNCPYCRRVAPILAELQGSDPQLRLVYKELPILGANSGDAAKAALASIRQGKYSQFHRALIEASGSMTGDRAIAIATTVGINTEQLKRDMQDPSIADAIRRNYALAQALRITGTPGFVVNQEVVQGALDLEAFKAVIKRMRDGSAH